MAWHAPGDCPRFRGAVCEYGQQQELRRQTQRWARDWQRHHLLTDEYQRRVEHMLRLMSVSYELLEGAPPSSLATAETQLAVFREQIAVQRMALLRQLGVGGG